MNIFYHRHYHPVFVLSIIFILMFFANKYAHANPSIRLELGNRGMATVTVTLEPQQPQPLPAGSLSPAVLMILVLPFDLDDFYKISKRDDIEVTLLLNGDDYCVFALLASKIDTETKIRIDNAFNLVDERAHNRIKFSCDTNFRYLKQQRNILSHSLTVSEFDITISLPKKYEIQDLSYEPSRNEWIEVDPGKTYTLKTSSAKQYQSPIWIAFPSPFEGGLHIAQFVISIVVGLVILILQGRFAFQRKLGPKMLTAILVLSILALGLAIYFCFTLANPMEFLAWVVGILIPIVFAPFICIYFLVRSRYEAEVYGNVTIDGEKAKYVDVSLYDKKSPNKSLINMSVKDDGSYRFFYWCKHKKIDAFVIASGNGTTSGESEVFILEPLKKAHVKVIGIKRREIRQEPQTSS